MPPLPGLPVSLLHDAYKGKAPTEPGAIGRMSGTLQGKVGKHFEQPSAD